MKKTLCILIAVMFAFGLAACGAPAATETPSPKVPESTPEKTPETTVEPAPEPVIVFSDDVLEGLVREAMNKPEGSITVTEAEAVESFDFRVEEPSNPSPRIEDISALQYFKNLKYLDLSYHLVEDLTPLAGLKNLDTLNYFDARSVKDFSALSEMTGIKHLVIASESFTNADMQRLAGKTNIESIWIQGWPELTDISVVADFQKLNKLNIEYSGVSDINAVAGLTGLVEMSLRGSQVSDVSPLKGLVNLKTLYLEGCPITDYSPLAGIYPNLTSKDFELN